MTLYGVSLIDDVDLYSEITFWFVNPQNWIAEDVNGCLRKERVEMLVSVGASRVQSGSREGDK